MCVPRRVPGLGWALGRQTGGLLSLLARGALSPLLGDQIFVLALSPLSTHQLINMSMQKPLLPGSPPPWLLHHGSLSPCHPLLPHHILSVMSVLVAEAVSVGE